MRVVIKATEIEVDGITEAMAVAKTAGTVLQSLHP